MQVDLCFYRNIAAKIKNDPTNVQLYDDLVSVALADYARARGDIITSTDPVTQTLLKASAILEEQLRETGMPKLYKAH